MERQNPIVEKSFQFSVRIVNLHKHLVREHKEYVLSKQLLRSGTSIGANVNEAQAAQSNADFISKMSIASKEARETKYWLQLLCETEYLDKAQPHVISLLEQSEELIKILTTIVKNTQKNIKANSKK